MAIAPRSLSGSAVRVVDGSVGEGLDHVVYGGLAWAMGVVWKIQDAVSVDVIDQAVNFHEEVPTHEVRPHGVDGDVGGSVAVTVVAENFPGIGQTIRRHH